jgi:hypothetical protein
MRISQEVGQERVHIQHFPGCKIEDQYAILGGFKQPPATNFGSSQPVLSSLAQCDIAISSRTSLPSLNFQATPADLGRDFASCHQLVVALLRHCYCRALVHWPISERWLSHRKHALRDFSGTCQHCRETRRFDKPGFSSGVRSTTPSVL